MDVLMSRLATIRDECNVKGGTASAPKEKVDKFTAKKRAIATQLSDVRKMIKERDAQERENPQSQYTVELSHNIRMTLQAAQGEYDKLMEQQKAQEAKAERAKAKGKKGAEDLNQQLSFRADVLKVIEGHLEECSSLEKRRGAAKAMTAQQQSDPTVTKLPDINDERFQLLLRNDAEIDRLLDMISDGVAVLGDMAKDMHDEIEMQSVMLDKLDTRVDKTNVGVTNLNKRLKTVLQQTRSADKFCTDFILIAIVLGLGGLIYTFARRL